MLLAWCLVLNKELPDPEWRTSGCLPRSTLLTEGIGVPDPQMAASQFGRTWGGSLFSVPLQNKVFPNLQMVVEVERILFWQEEVQLLVGSRLM